MPFRDIWVEGDAFGFAPELLDRTGMVFPHFRVPLETREDYVAVLAAMTAVENTISGTEVAIESSGRQFFVAQFDDPFNAIPLSCLAYAANGGRNLEDVRDDATAAAEAKMLMADARAALLAIQRSMPRQVNAEALKIDPSSAAYQLLVYREAMLWRVEELARTAIEAYGRSDFVVAGTLARSVTESAAMMWRLKDVLAGRQSKSPEELRAFARSLLAGSKSSDWMLEGAPQAINVLTCLDRMNRAMPGVRLSYDGLSEVAHPNWRGVAGLFTNWNPGSSMTDFGRDRSLLVTIPESIVSGIALPLRAFLLCYNSMADDMEAFIREAPLTVEGGANPPE